MNLKTFLEHFDAIAEAPGGIPKLRSRILDLAVRGKLVPQNPEDEPASTLVQAIKNEQAQLIKEKILKTKLLPSPLADEIPFIPCNKWIWEKIGNLCFVTKLAGFEYTEYIRLKDQGEIPVVRAQNVRMNKLDTNNVKFIDLDVSKSLERSALTKKALLMTFIGAGIGDVAVFAFEQRWHLAPNVAKLEPFNNYGEKIDIRYLLLFLMSKTGRDEIFKHRKSTAQPSLSMETIRDINVVIPPLAEQKRIVVKVDELMALCDRCEAAKQTRDNLRQKLRESAIASFMNAETDEELDAAWAIVRDNWCEVSQCPEDVDSLRQAVLQLAVQGKLTIQDPTDQSASLLVSQIKEKKNYLTKSKQSKKPDDIPFEIPSNWVWLRIDDFYDVSGGIQKTPKRTPVSNYFPYLRVANVQRGYLDLGEIEYFELLEGELERWNLQPGDLLIVEGNGSSKEIGRCAIWNGEIEKCVHQNHIIRVRPIAHEGQLFTLMFLNSPSGMTEMRNLAITTSGLYSLSVGKIREILVPLPPPAEQKRIVAKVDELMKLCDQLEASLRHSQQRAESLAASAISHLTI